MGKPDRIPPRTGRRRASDRARLFHNLLFERGFTIFPKKADADIRRVSTIMGKSVFITTLPTADMAIEYHFPAREGAKRKRSAVRK